MAAEIAENNAVKISDELICESCGATFVCGARAGKCWCFAVEVKEEILSELRENFQRCLCGNCLSAAGNQIDESI